MARKRKPERLSGAEAQFKALDAVDNLIAGGMSVKDALAEVGVTRGQIAGIRHRMKHGQLKRPEGMKRPSLKETGSVNSDTNALIRQVIEANRAKINQLEAANQYLEVLVAVG